MTRLGRWWSDRSATERFDLSTRLSLYGLLGMPLLFVTSAVTSPEVADRATGTWLAVTLVSLAAAHIAVCALLVRRSLARFLGGAARLGRLTVTGLAFTGAAATIGSLAEGRDPEGTPLGVMLGVVFAGMLAGSIAPVVPTAGLAAAVGGSAALAAAAGAVLGDSGTAVQGATFAFIWVGSMSLTYRFSAWMVGVVWELDRGRAAAARLAVAEERLRFSRDLHDVLGRNLSVIAVKSELAGRLAERGEPGAAAEMLEVRQVAHDSLKEVRDVVSGYRTADLEAELAGARSVLRSAGVECRVIGDGAHLPEPVQAALGWVVREATTNVIRHSDATTCTIGLELTDAGGTAVLRMENDRARGTAPGAGTAVEPGAGGTGVGLAGLAERLAGVGGRLTAGRRGGDRFVVEACVPVTAP